MSNNENKICNLSLVALTNILQFHLEDLKIYTELMQQELNLEEVNPYFDNIFAAHKKNANILKLLQNKIIPIEVEQLSFNNLIENFFENFTASINLQTFINQTDEDLKGEINQQSFKDILISLSECIATLDAHSKVDILLKKIKKDKIYYAEVILTNQLDFIDKISSDYSFEISKFYHRLIDNPSFIKSYGSIIAQKGDLFIYGEEQQILISLQFPINFVDDKIKSLSLYGTETILVVDDEDTIWSLFIETLKSYGYNVILAENGEECVNIYTDNTEQIDLVSLDIIMPKMDGHTAFKKLKEINHKVKVIISSGYAKEHAKYFIENGAVAFLQKPYPMIRLLEEIRQALDN